MPEALALLLVGLVAGLIFVITRATTRPPSAAEERVRLAQRIAWLEERAAHAAAHRWDETMCAQIAEQLALARRQLAALEAAA